MITKRFVIDDSDWGVPDYDKIREELEKEDVPGKIVVDIGKVFMLDEG